MGSVPRRSAGSAHPFRSFDMVSFVPRTPMLVPLKSENIDGVHGHPALSFPYEPRFMGSRLTRLCVCVFVCVPSRTNHCFFSPILFHVGVSYFFEYSPWNFEFRFRWLLQKRLINRRNWFLGFFTFPQTRDCSRGYLRVFGIIGNRTVSGRYDVD